MQDPLSAMTTALTQLQRGDDNPTMVVFSRSAEPSYYIQCVLQDDPESIHAEAVSNSFLRGRLALGENQIARLTSLGWSSPESIPNFYRDFRAGDESGRDLLARFLLRTLQQVYGWAPGEAVEIEFQSI